MTRLALITAVLLSTAICVCAHAAVAPPPAHVRIVDCGADFLRGGDGLPLHQFHVHRWGLQKDSATGLWTPQPRVQTDLSTDVDGDGTTNDDVVAYHEFSLTRPFSPDAPWYDALAGSPRWYGGAALCQANARSSGFSEDGVNQEHDGPMYLPRDNWALFHETYEINAPYRLGAVWLWKKEDFLNGGARHRVSFDDSSSLALYLQRYFMCVDGVRFAIQDGDQFYLSEQVFKGAGQQRGMANGKQHVLCPAATRWAPYNPTAPHNIWFDAAKAAFQQRAFRDVRAVGFYVFKDRFIPSYFGFKWYAFEVDALVHRPARPSETIAMTAVDGSTNVPAFCISSAPVPYLTWKNVFRLARSNTFVQDPRGFIFDRDGDMGSMDADDLPHTPHEPVTDITLHDAAAWCNALSQHEGKTPCYYEDAACTSVFRFVKRSPMYGPQRALPTLHVRWAADGYRLPVAAERAVTDTGLWLVRREPGLPPPAGNLTPQFTVGPRRAPAPVVPDNLFTMVPIPGTPLECATHETSYAAWKLVRDWACAHGYTFDSDGDMGSMDYWGMPNGWGAARTHSPDEPVTDLTYYDIAVWCNALSECAGRTPVYYTDAACTSVYKHAFVYRPLMQLFFETDRDQDAGLLPRDRMLAVGRVAVKADADGYRLPTDGEFARARGQKAGPSALLDRAWLFDNSDGTTHPVGSKAANALGLFDIEGNVSELCMGSTPAWDVVSGVGLMTRNGGSFTELAVGMQSDQTQYTPAGWGYPDTGFRVVRTIANKKATALVSWLAALSHLVPNAEAAALPATPTRAATPIATPQGTFNRLSGRVARGSLLCDGVINTIGPTNLAALQWKFKTGGPVKSSPVVVDGVVYFGSNDGHIYAVDAASGTERWKVKTDAKVSGAAAVVDGLVFIASESGVLYAINAQTGAVKWQSPLGNTKPCGAPAVANGIVYLGSGANGGSEQATMTARPVTGFDVKTGAKVWEAQGGPQGYAAICLDGTVMYAGNNGHDFAAYDLATGKRLWSKIPGHQDRQFGTMVKHGDAVYFAGSMAGSVNAHDARTGQQRWMTYLNPDQVLINNGGEPGYEILGSPAVAHGRMYVGCNDGKLHTFTLDKGERGWTFTAGGPIQSSPSIAGTVVYFGSHDGHLYALDALSGALRGTYKTGGRIVSTPWPADGVVYVGCDDGCVYAIR